jgi:lysylphosphatidylglycerol synthetase-like protein (DUF2156 family)
MFHSEKQRTVTSRSFVTATTTGVDVDVDVGVGDKGAVTRGAVLVLPGLPPERDRIPSQRFFRGDRSGGAVGDIMLFTAAAVFVLVLVLVLVLGLMVCWGLWDFVLCWFYCSTVLYLSRRRWLRKKPCVDFLLALSLLLFIWR